LSVWRIEGPKTPSIVFTVNSACVGPASRQFHGWPADMLVSMARSGNRVRMV